MHKKLIGLCFGLLLLIPSSILANGINWTEDLEQAKIEAKDSNKYIFVSFSGSDWCHWCIQLDKEVFSSKQFQDYAEEELVMVLVDFPKRKKQSPEQKMKNDKLSRQYRVRGFPSIALLNPQGELVSMTGYRRGGADAYIDHVKFLINNSSQK